MAVTEFVGQDVARMKDLESVLLSGADELHRVRNQTFNIMGALGKIWRGRVMEGFTDLWNYRHAPALGTAEESLRWAAEVVRRNLDSQVEVSGTFDRGGMAATTQGLGRVRSSRSSQTLTMSAGPEILGVGLTGDIEFGLTRTTAFDGSVTVEIAVDGGVAAGLVPGIDLGRTGEVVISYEFADAAEADAFENRLKLLPLRPDTFVRPEVALVEALLLEDAPTAIEVGRGVEVSIGGRYGAYLGDFGVGGDIGFSGAYSESVVLDPSSRDVEAYVFEYNASLDGWLRNVDLAGGTMNINGDATADLVLRLEVSPDGQSAELHFEGSVAADGAASIGRRDFAASEGYAIEGFIDLTNSDLTLSGLVQDPAALLDAADITITKTDFDSDGAGFEASPIPGISFGGVEGTGTTETTRDVWLKPPGGTFTNVDPNQ